jgi:hypothetical protein
MSRELTETEWRAEGVRRFGDNTMAWRFVCPVCKHVAAVADWKAANAPANAVAFSCVGRWLPDEPRGAFTNQKGSPCNYAGGGLFKLNPVRVKREVGVSDIFEFAEPSP